MAYPIAEYISPDEYLANEIASEAKHEYFDGLVHAMAGASRDHNRIVSNMVGELHSMLKGKECEVFPSDIRIVTPFSDAYMYPDVSIVCEDNDKNDNATGTITNPSVIIEVMSPSTEKIDLGYKYFKYLQIPSLREYILVDSTSCSIKSIRIQEDRSWKIEDITNIEESLHIHTVNARVALKDIYRRVTFAV